VELKYPRLLVCQWINFPKIQSLQLFVECDGNSNRNNQKMSENCRKCVILRRACYLKVLPIWMNGRVGPVVSWYCIWLVTRRPELNSQLNKFSLISLLFQFLFPSHTTNLYLSEITVNRLPKGKGWWSKDKMRQLVVVTLYFPAQPIQLLYMYVYIHLKYLFPSLGNSSLKLIQCTKNKIKIGKVYNLA